MLPFAQPSLEGSPIRRRLVDKLSRLEQGQIYVGTSSWKYEGWMGQIYTEERYRTRGRLSRKKFEENCIAEYAEVFPIVCGDFAFYQFPSDSFWHKLFTTAPSRLRWAFKVPEEITVKQWPAHARYGTRAGLENENFLNSQLFERLFLDALKPYKSRVAAMIFEFGTMSKKSMPGLDAFVTQLNRFLSELPPDWRYSIEVRNPEYLQGDYFDCLRSYNTAHVFNAWSRMPELDRQIAMDGAFTADFTVARALLRYGRSYEQAVKTFEPYESLKEENPATRDALRALIARAKRLQQPSFVFVNNRLEGNAPATIDAITSDAELTDVV